MLCSSNTWTGDVSDQQVIHISPAH